MRYFHVVQVTTDASTWFTVLTVLTVPYCQTWNFLFQSPNVTDPQYSVLVKGGHFKEWGKIIYVHEYPWPWLFPPPHYVAILWDGGWLLCQLCVSANLRIPENQRENLFEIQTVQTNSICLQVWTFHALEVADTVSDYPCERPPSFQTSVPLFISNYGKYSRPPFERRPSWETTPHFNQCFSTYPLWQTTNVQKNTFWVGSLLVWGGLSKGELLYSFHFEAKAIVQRQRVGLYVVHCITLHCGLVSLASARKQSTLSHLLHQWTGM